MLRGQGFGSSIPMDYDREVLWGFLQVLPDAIARINSTPSDKRNASTFLDDLTALASEFDIEHEISKAGFGDYFAFSPDQLRQMHFLLMYVKGAVERSLNP